MESLPVQTPAMARMVLRGVTALAALAALTWTAGSAGKGISATVISIGDGDTIRVRQAGRAITVRLACIDAPETAQSPYGQQARNVILLCRQCLRVYRIIADYCLHQFTRQ